MTKIINSTQVMEGVGVSVYRTIGTLALRSLDPFLMLDHMSSDNPNDYIAGFPPHPHRGFITFTYVVDGDMEHQDSMGNTGNPGAGGAQWMKAASGVIHSEMPRQKEGLLRGFQLWINLPAANKMDKPEYQEYKSDSFPVVRKNDYVAKVLIGTFGDSRSPIVDDITNVQYLDIELKAGKLLIPERQAGHAVFLYIFEGSLQVDGQLAPGNSLVVLANETTPSVITAGSSEDARFLLVSGKPIDEPVVQYGPFVMNTREEIDQAMQDYQSNNFVRDRAWLHKKKK